MSTMSSPWKKQPEVVAELVLKRAEVSKMARKLQTTLALAGLKAEHGWEKLTLKEIEPRIPEIASRKRPNSSMGDAQSDSSSSASDFTYPRNLLSSSPLKPPPHFSDAINSSNGTTGHRKRTFNASFQHPSDSQQRKRYRSSPTPGRKQSNHTAWKDHHSLAQSSPIKPRRQSHFTTSAGPNISFSHTSHSHGIHSSFANNSSLLGSGSDDEDDLVSNHNFSMSGMEIRSSPPRTPPSRHRGMSHRAPASSGKNVNGRLGDDGADLLLYLATSPSPANRPRHGMAPLSTPPSRTLALPSSLMTTPGGSHPYAAGFGNPTTPNQNFDFADFVNITPSPAQNAWARTPSTIRTPVTITRRSLNFDRSPAIGSAGRGNEHGLGMSLGGDLL